MSIDESLPLAKLENLRSERSESIAGVGEVLVRTEVIGTPVETITSTYTMPGKERAFATMSLARKGDTYNLFFRWVDPGFREMEEAHIGTALYNEAESRVRATAAAEDTPLTLRARVDQISVLNWLLKLGYAPAPESKGTYDDLIAHPARYSVDANDYGDGHRPYFIYARADDGSIGTTPVEIILTKVIEPASETPLS